LCIYFLLILFKFWVWIRKRGGPNNVVWGYVSCRRRCFMDNFRLARQNRRTVSSLDAIYSSTTDGRTDGKILFLFFLELASNTCAPCHRQISCDGKKKSWFSSVCLFGCVCVGTIETSSSSPIKLPCGIGLYADTSTHTHTCNYRPFCVCVWCLPAPSENRLVAGTLWVSLLRCSPASFCFSYRRPLLGGWMESWVNMIEKMFIFSDGDDDIVRQLKTNAID
jgi:hypothetical protein